MRDMSRKLVLLMTLTLVLIYILSIAVKIQRVEASGTIYIRPNGDVDPSTAPIKRDGNSYTLTNNIYDEIVIMRSNVIIDGNGFTLEVSGTGFQLPDVSNVTIKKTGIKASDYAIHLKSASNNTISGNFLTHYQKGIYLTYSSNYNKINENSLSANLGTAVSLTDNSKHNIISGNNITDNKFGITLHFVSNNTISRNNIINNEETGIYLYSSSNNTIFGNYISTHWKGIHFMDFCSNNIVYENTITNNMYGIYLWQSSNNKFYHNSFVDNTHHVLFSSSRYKNLWDDSFPSGGNYWSDYKERYPNATEIDDSGIWNTPYVIDEYNQDNYPLIPEFPSFLILPLFMIITLPAVIVYKTKHQTRNKKREV